MTGDPLPKVKGRRRQIVLEGYYFILGGELMAKSDVCPQIAVRMPEDVGQWGLVELQGVIETRDRVPFNGMHIGDLHFNSKGVPSLIVGHHLLTGRVQNMEKPFAILSKKSNISGDLLNSNNTMNSNEDNGRASDATEYEVIALITKKILFNNRPKPIITKTGIKKI